MLLIQRLPVAAIQDIVGQQVCLIVAGQPRARYISGEKDVYDPENPLPEKDTA